MNRVIVSLIRNIKKVDDEKCFFSTDQNLKDNDKSLFEYLII